MCTPRHTPLHLHAPARRPEPQQANMRYHDDATNVPPKISGTQALPRTPRTSTPFLRTTPGTQSVSLPGPQAAPGTGGSQRRFARRACCHFS